MAISLSEAYNSEKKKHQEMFRTCREILGLGVSYGFLHFLMVNPWVSDFPSNVALHSSSWNPKACEATGAVSGVQQPYNLLVGGLEPWNFMTFHSVGNSKFQLTNSIIFHQPEPSIKNMLGVDQDLSDAIFVEIRSPLKLQGTRILTN